MITLALLAAKAAIAATMIHPAAYTVAQGDTLSAIGAADSVSWQAIWSDNRATVTDPNLIYPGEVLAIPAPGTRATVTAYVPAYQAPAQPAYQAPAQPAYQAPAQPAYVPAQAPAAASSGATAGGYPGGAFGACVVAAESGGNAQVTNASDHWGLYQFAAGTWAEYGGSPASFGSASAATQEQIFSNALAAGGQSNWSLYDHC